MSNTKKNRKGNMSEGEPREQTSSLNEEMSEDELEGIAAAGAWTKGTSQDDYMIGGDGDDTLVGMGGSDVILGGDGNDTLDGGYLDGADDVVLGGEGNDLFFWGPSRDGSDFFDGGEGNDDLRIDMRGTGQPSLQAALDSGYLTLTIEGDPDFVPTFDDQGNMVLPDGVSGTITGPTGETIRFTDVETISSI